MIFFPLFYSIKTRQPRDLNREKAARCYKFSSAHVVLWCVWTLQLRCGSKLKWEGYWESTQQPDHVQMDSKLQRIWKIRQTDEFPSTVHLGWCENWILQENKNRISHLLSVFRWHYSLLHHPKGIYEQGTAHSTKLYKLLIAWAVHPKRISNIGLSSVKL